MVKNAAVLWTGGKDCALAFFKAQKLGIKISHLVTFVPEVPDFKAHNLNIIRRQIQAIGLPHLQMTVKAPMIESYEDAITELKNQYNINLLITGDIDEIENHDNWIEERAKKTGVEVFNPLWKKEREGLINELLQNNFKIIFTLVKKSFFTKKWIGKQLDYTILDELKSLDIDICGENGEYHSMVLHAPFFKKTIDNFSTTTIETDYYYYLQV